MSIIEASNELYDKLKPNSRIIGSGINGDVITVFFEGKWYQRKPQIPNVYSGYKVKAKKINGFIGL